MNVLTRGASAVGLMVSLAGCHPGDWDVEVQSPLTTEAVYVPRSDVWLYWNQGEDFGTAWREHAWVPPAGQSSGTAPIGYGESYVATTISYGADPANKPTTVYFRKAFYVENPAQVVALRLDVMYDDGFVAYVNGQEGGRGNMPAGAVSSRTFAASSHEAGASYESFDASAARGALQAGWNTLAVEMHQHDLDSSDLVFDATLVAQVGTAPPPPPPSSGAVQVCASGAPFTRIAAAIAAAPAGATIQICPGTYHERLGIDAKPLSLVGTGGAAVTIIDGGAGGGVLTVAATGGGGGVTLQGLTLRNGSTSGNGGGVQCASSTLRIVDCVFTGNVAENGGALAATGCALDVSRSRFEANRARAEGGAARVDGSSGQIAECQLVGNRAVLGGGVHVREGTVAVAGNDVRSNVAELRGGGLYHASSSQVTGNTFADNQALWIGGGIYVETHAPLFQGNTVSGSWSVNDGGGIYVHQSQATIRANHFHHNHSGDDGAGLRIFESNCRVEANLVEHNVADGAGGGMRIGHLPSQVIDNIVRNNTAADTGGGMDLDNDSSAVRGGEISGNVATRGGGINMYLGAWNGAAIEGVVITGNRASRGGGIQLDDNFQPVALRGLIVADNVADDGGGIYARATHFTLTQSVLRGNRANNRGGGIYTGANGSWGRACPCPPTNPRARIDFVVVHGNTAPAGSGLWTSFGDLTVASSILFGNTGGPSVTASGTVPPQWRYNDTSPATFSGTPIAVAGNGNISADPLFVNAPGGDFHLANGSPCVDAGDPAILDGNGTRADMGRYGGP
jgi:predicted outer membrane repeat protein